VSEKAHLGVVDGVVREDHAQRRERRVQQVVHLLAPQREAVQGVEVEALPHRRPQRALRRALARDDRANNRGRGAARCYAAAGAATSGAAAMATTGPGEIAGGQPLLCRLRKDGVLVAVARQNGQEALEAVGHRHRRDLGELGVGAAAEKLDEGRVPNRDGGGARLIVVVAVVAPLLLLLRAQPCQRGGAREVVLAGGRGESRLARRFAAGCRLLLGGEVPARGEEA